MDLSVLIVMFVATLLVLVGLYFFLMKPLAGKSYEEMQKEKLAMREKIMGTGAGAATSAKSSKDNANKKTKKVNKNKQQQKQKAAVKDSDQDSVVETESAESEFEEEINPLTYAKKKVNASVEYAETEAFALNADGHGKKKDKPNQGKKNNKQKGGILLNKSEPVLVKQESAQEINHFEEIHPKDALEIARQHKEEDAKKSQPKEVADKARQPAAATTAAVKKEEEVKTKSHPKDQRKQKNKENAKPPLTKTSAVEEIPVVPAVVAPVVTANPVAAPAEVKSSANVVNKDKSNKKKKNELITQQLAAEVHDAVNVQSLVRILAKADLPRNDIQILIDFLLNKQQDTLTKDPSEWNDPSDPLQKLKKQLQEKQNQLDEEQKGAAGLHAKLKELRQELNSEKSQASAVVKGFNEELNNKKLEVQSLSQQLQLVSDKYSAEKQALTHQFQQLQAKYVQLSEKHAAAQEGVASVAQLNENMQILQRELMTKSQLLNEKLQVEEELLKKKTEYEMLLRSKDEALQQRAQDVAAYEAELQQLRVVATQKDELAKSCQQQSFEIDQLKSQLGELQLKQKQAAAASNQVEESSKVELRNLQNALDSSKTELAGCRAELVAAKSRSGDQDQQLKELRVREEDLQKQLHEQREKNNDLRMKNWKLIEALQVAQSKTATTNTSQSSKVELTAAASKIASNHVVVEAPAPKVDIDKVILEEQNRTKDLLVKLLPTEIVSALPLDAANFYSWLESTVVCIQEQQQECIRTATEAAAAAAAAAASVAVTTTTNSNNSTEVGHLNCNSRSSNNNSSLYENNDANGNDGSNKNGAPEGDLEDQQVLAQRNEQLQKTVDQYKTIIADTEIMLKNLESKVIEQDIHWRSVVQAKEKELNLLKSAGAMQ
ncbi:ribosome-binding protein 1 isoform X1 [Culex quinquefasciatus]|uniref:ribosome-binding protein 1 isoform X1 n=1 Tax=Culex quinquefasciatus TaxID=7176 RepID=UPI0018E2B7AA|nr:ribosome-binding protein 1 isoform X1 [Culex quinquefasciatus]